MRAETERKIDDKETKVDLVIHVDRGAMYSFGKLGIEGRSKMSKSELQHAVAGAS